MSADEFSGMSDDQLVMYVKGHAGAPGAGAQTELMRRLADTMSGLRASTDELRKETLVSGARMERFTRQIRWMTGVLVVLTIAMTVMTAALLR